MNQNAAHKVSPQSVAALCMPHPDGGVYFRRKEVEEAISRSLGLPSSALVEHRVSTTPSILSISPPSACCISFAGSLSAANHSAIFSRSYGSGYCGPFP